MYNSKPKSLKSHNDSDFEKFDVNLVKCCEPILIGDKSLTAEENKELDNNGYPPGYDDVFDCIFLPEEWKENGKTWRRVASMEPANRTTAIELVKELKWNMSYWQAETVGLCGMRKELYAQCFDELIRQECLNDMNRGQLLVRIRDDYKTTLNTHKQIFEDALMFCSKKSKFSPSKILDIENLEEKNRTLKKDLTDAKFAYNILKINLTDELNTLKTANLTEIDFYTKNQEVLKEQLDILLAMDKETDQ